MGRQPHNRKQETCFTALWAPVKTTIEIPDDLFRAVKARAALENVRIKDLMAGLLRGWLEHGTAALQPGETGESAERERRAQEMADWLSEWQSIGRRIEDKSVDPRSMVEILAADRR